MIDDANFAPDGIADEEDIPYIKEYKSYIYDDPIESENEEDENEDIVLKDDAFEEMITHHGDGLIESVS